MLMLPLHGEKVFALFICRYQIYAPSCKLGGFHESDNSIRYLKFNVVSSTKAVIKLPLVPTLILLQCLFLFEEIAEAVAKCLNNSSLMNVLSIELTAFHEKKIVWQKPSQQASTLIQ